MKVLALTCDFQDENSRGKRKVNRSPGGECSVSYWGTFRSRVPLNVDKAWLRKAFRVSRTSGTREAVWTCRRAGTQPHPRSPAWRRWEFALPAGWTPGVWSPALCLPGGLELGALGGLSRKSIQSSPLFTG